MKLLEITADDAERWERKKKKKNPDTGFAGRSFQISLLPISLLHGGVTLIIILNLPNKT